MSQTNGSSRYLYAKRDGMDTRQFQGMILFLVTYGSRAQFMRYETNNLFLVEKGCSRQVAQTICLWSGAEDQLAIDPKRRFHAQLEDCGIEHNYIENRGVHDRDYGDSHLPAALEWPNRKRTLKRPLLKKTGRLICCKHASLSIAGLFLTSLVVIVKKYRK